MVIILVLCHVVQRGIGYKLSPVTVKRRLAPSAPLYSAKGRECVYMFFYIKQEITGITYKDFLLNSSRKKIAIC